MTTETRQPQFNKITVLTFSQNLQAAEYVCGSKHLTMGVEGYRLRQTIPGSARMSDRLIDEITARAAEYRCTVTVDRKSSTQWSVPFAICHETTIVLSAERD